MSDIRIPAFVLTRNMPTWSQDICEKLDAAGLEIIIFDNHSTYKPMIKWLDTVKDRYIVIRINCDYGAASPYLPWMIRVDGRNLVDFIMKDLMDIQTDRYIVTDFDLDLTIGNGLLGIMDDFMDRYPYVPKVGLSLSWQDHNHPWHMYEFLNEVQAHSAQYSEKILETVEYEDISTDFFENVTAYDAPIDTTFAMYDLTREFRPMMPTGGIRLSLNNSGALHRPWTQPSGHVMVDPEQYYYVMSCGNGIGYWTSMMKNLIESRLQVMREVNLDIKNSEEKSDTKVSINNGDLEPIQLRPYLTDGGEDVAFKVM